MPTTQEDFVWKTAREKTCRVGSGLGLEDSPWNISSSVAAFFLGKHGILGRSFFFSSSPLIYPLMPAVFQPRVCSRAQRRSIVLTSFNMACFLVGPFLTRRFYLSEASRLNPDLSPLASCSFCLVLPVVSASPLICSLPSLLL